MISSLHDELSSRRVIAAMTPLAAVLSNYDIDHFNELISRRTSSISSRRIDIEGLVQRRRSTRVSVGDQIEMTIKFHAFCCVRR